MINPSVETRTAESTKEKIKRHEARVGIIGLGYVGLPLALLFTDQKFPVTGFDIDRRKVETLAQGGSYIYRIAK
jgi:UDP-N-acetyl-D-glucosamine dehydrogenase